MILPQLSVLLPVYNEEYYLAECIDSILAQTGVSFEICISDNASTDRTWEIVNSYREDYEFIKAYRQPSLVHPFDNFTQTIRMAKGLFVYLIGGDDYLLPGFFDEAISQFRAHPHLSGFLVTLKVFNDGTNEILGTGPPRSFEAELNQPNIQFIKFILSHINHDEIFLGVFKRKQLARSVSLINRISIESIGIWFFIAITLVAKDYRYRIKISKYAYLMKRTAKCKGIRNNYKVSESGARSNRFLSIERLFGSLQNVFRLKVYGLIGWSEVFLLLFASRHHSSLGWLSLGPALVPFTWVARKAISFVMRLATLAFPKQ